MNENRRPTQKDFSPRKPEKDSAFLPSGIVFDAGTSNQSANPSADKINEEWGRMLQRPGVDLHADLAFQGPRPILRQ